MGPLRGRLTTGAIWLLSAAPAMAEVCDKERPDWTPAHGPASGLDELVFLVTSLPGLGILGALTLALLTGGRLYWSLTTLFSSLIALALWTEQATDPTGLRALAIAEGCVGPQTLPIAACLVTAAFSALMGTRAYLSSRH